MSSSANFLATYKSALPTSGGVAPIVPVYFTWSATTTESTAKDINGNDLNMDFDGRIVGFSIVCSEHSGAGAISFDINGTTMFAPNLGDGQVFTGTSSSFAGYDFTAGNAAVTVTSANSAKGGYGVFWCLVTS